MYVLTMFKGRKELKSVEDSTLYFFYEGGSFDLIKNPKKDDIKVGGKVLIFKGYNDYIKTEEITKVCTKINNCVKIHTSVSKYRLFIND